MALEAFVNVYEVALLNFQGVKGGKFCTRLEVVYLSGICCQRGNLYIIVYQNQDPPKICKLYVSECGLKPGM